MSPSGQPLPLFCLFWLSALLSVYSGSLALLVHVLYLCSLCSPSGLILFSITVLLSFV